MYSLQEATEQASGNLAVDHYEVALEEVKVLSPDSVEFSGETMALSNNGQRSLCKLLEIPNNFNTRLHADDTILWKEMTSKLEKLRSQEVRVSVVRSEHDTHMIEAFNKKTSGWIATEEFLKLVAFWTEFQPVKLNLTGIGLDNLGTSVAHFMFAEAEGKILTDHSDIFKLGLTLVNSETLKSRSRISVALHRMICTNRAMIPDKEFTIWGKHTKGSERLIEDMWADIQTMVQSNISIQKYIDARINRLSGVCASLMELETAHKMIKKNVSNVDMVVPDLSTRIPFDSVLAKYGIDPSTKSSHWKSTASTPVNMYDLYNEVTWIGSHSDMIPEERDSLEVAVGSLFLSEKEPDMKDIAPPRTWN